MGAASIEYRVDRSGGHTTREAVIGSRGEGRGDCSRLFALIIYLLPNFFPLPISFMPLLANLSASFNSNIYLVIHKSVKADVVS